MSDWILSETAVRLRLYIDPTTARANRLMTRDVANSRHVISRLRGARAVEKETARLKAKRTKNAGKAARRLLRARLKLRLMAEKGFLPSRAQAGAADESCAARKAAMTRAPRAADRHSAFMNMVPELMNSPRLTPRARVSRRCNTREMADSRVRKRNCFGGFGRRGAVPAVRRPRDLSEAVAAAPEAARKAATER